MSVKFHISDCSAVSLFLDGERQQKGNTKERSKQYHYLSQPHIIDLSLEVLSSYICKIQ